MPSPLRAQPAAEPRVGDGRNLDSILRIPVLVQVVLGSATMPVANLMKLGRGAVVPLDHRVGEPVDVMVNGRVRRPRRDRHRRGGFLPLRRLADRGGRPGRFRPGRLRPQPWRQLPWQHPWRHPPWPRRRRPPPRPCAARGASSRRSTGSRPCCSPWASPRRGACSSTSSPTRSGASRARPCSSARSARTSSTAWSSPSRSSSLAARAWSAPCRRSRSSSPA